MADIDLIDNMTPNSTSPFADTAYPNGDRPASGEAAAGTFTVSGTLSDRETITITAGTANFGAIGPELLFASDAKDTTAGNALGATDFDGIGVMTQLADNLMVESVPELPQGKGFVIGAQSSGNASDYGGISVEHPTLEQTPKFYEHVVYYWPQAHQDTAQASLDGSAVWQVKTIWPRFGPNNVSDEYKLHNSYGLFFNPGPYFTGSAVVSSGLAGTSWLPFAENADIQTDPKTSFMRPDIISQQTAVDIDTVNGSISTYLRNKGTGVVSYDQFLGQTMVLAPTIPHIGPTRFTFPGYARGFSSGDGMHMYMADIFYQWGEGALARVEITDNADYELGNLVPCEVLTWGATGLTAKIRTGVFHGESLSGKWVHIHAANELYIGAYQL